MTESNNNTELTILSNNSIVQNNYTLNLSDIEDDYVGQLDSAINVLRKATSLDTLTIRINSHGGYVDNGILLHNCIKECFRERTTTIIDTKAISMAALIFLAGDTRLVYPHSLFMVHTYSGVYVGKSDEVYSQYAAYDTALQNYFSGMLKDFLTKKELKDIKKGKDLWLSAPMLIERNIATDILE
jgi:ATP-dependent protease ClpP protease subunit